MVHTTIESIDSTGETVVPSADLKRRVDRAAELLEKELASIKKFAIESRWRIVHQPGSAPRVELNLTSGGSGIREWVLNTEGWDEDAQVVRALRTPIWYFADAQSRVVRSDVDRIGRELHALAPLTGE